MGGQHKERWVGPEGGLELRRQAADGTPVP